MNRLYAVLPCTACSAFILRSAYPSSVCHSKRLSFKESVLSRIYPSKQLFFYAITAGKACV